MLREKGCFLIADDVGLGKTITARTVLYEMMRLSDKPIHSIYIASSEPLARKNMQDEFLKDPYVRTRAEHYEKLAKFQKAHAVKALQMLWDDAYPSEDTVSDIVNVKTEKQLHDLSHVGRLSFLTGTESELKHSCIMQLSPITSFFDPNTVDVKKLAMAANDEIVEEGYTGNEKERNSLKTDFENTIKDHSKSRLYQEIYNAACYECKTIKEKNVAGWLEKLVKNLSDKTISQSDFLTARRIRSNAAAAIYKPDLIILDEFQRYRKIIEKPTNGYSVKYMLDYLRYRKIGTRILLLSATPYKMNKDDVEVDWGYDSKAYTAEAKNDSRENPFSDYATLKSSMNALGAPSSENEEDFLVRTERNFKKSAITIEHDVNASRKHQKDYMDKLVAHCIKNKNDFAVQDINTICRNAFENPEFWRFNAGYKEYCFISQKARKALLNNPPAYDVYSDLPMQSLITHVFDKDKQNELPQLWVPPVSAERPGTGKTLVFTTMAVSTRCAAYFCDNYAKEKILDSILGKCNLPDDKVSEDVIEELTEMIAQCIGLETKYDDYNRFREVLANFFNRPFVRKVICAHNIKHEWNCDAYSDAVSKYCDEYKFEEMIEEWLPIAQKNKPEKDSLADFIAKAFSHQPASIKMRTLKDDQEAFEYTNTDYTEMFVCDDGKTGNSAADKNNSVETARGEHLTVKDEIDIVNQFISPIYPMVLVARSSAQEGFNLQYYGDKIMHWQVAPTISAFLQREGRLDRPGSLTLRHRMRQCKNQPNVKDNNDGLIPMWYIPDADGVDAEITQILPVYEYNESLEKMVTELSAAGMYSKPLKNE